MKDELLDPQTEQNFIDKVIETNVSQTTDVKQVIDLASTKQAISNESTVKKLVDEKTEELVNDAVRKKVEAETDKIRKEVEKVRAEADKEIAELEKSIANKKAEYEELVAQDRKATAYYDAHKSILRCIGIREKLSLSAMKKWLVPANIVYFLFQVILLPLTLIGFGLEQIIGLVGTLVSKISSNGWKIAVSIIAIVIIVALLFAIYFGGSWAIKTLINR